MRQNQSSRRANELVREKLGYILLFEMSDPELALITLTGVEVSVDHSLARVYVSCDATRYEAVMAALERAKGRLRSLLGHALGWRTTPELVFVIDTTADEAERIASALTHIPETMGMEKDEFGYPVSDTAEEGVSDEQEGTWDAAT